MSAPSNSKQSGFKSLDRVGLARKVADDIPEGWFVNLGIGVPTMVADFVPPDREVIFHSENGILGLGPKPPDDQIERWLINAGKQYVTLRTGGSYFHHADSFAIIRGGHLDLCVLGAFEVSQSGDIANWTTNSTEVAPAVGGAMDLAVGAQRLWVVMEHTTKDGKPRLVKSCSYPLTAPGIVKRVYTNLATFDLTPDGFKLRDMVSGLSLSELQAVTEGHIIG